jgi:hypothetical protein
MSENMQQADEDRVLSSLYGMTLAGLRQMQKKPSNESIKHLIAGVIESKESEAPQPKRRSPRAGR